MIINDIITSYSFLTIFTIFGKRSFENMGRLINRSGDTVRRLLHPGSESLEESKKIAQQIFKNKNEILLIIDETTIKKIYSKLMEGTSWFFDTKIGRSIPDYKLIVGALSDGKFTIPINAAFNLGKELYPNPSEAQEATVQYFIATARKLLPNKKLVVVLDGAFATVKYLKWAISQNIATEVRMHSNRIVEYEGKKLKIREIRKFKPNGRQMARTIKIVWQGLSLYLTAVHRIDKHGNESFVYQAATYMTLPSKHAQNYKRRWGIEKLFRTTKQNLGLQECFSRKIVTQFGHICGVLLAYSILQLEMKKNSYKHPEAAIRGLNKKKIHRIQSIAFSL